MTYTTVEQSKRLMELRLNPDSADMSYSDKSIRGMNHTDTFAVSLMPYKKHKQFIENITNTQKGVCYWTVLPCWSAECLLNLLPDIIKTGDEARNWYWINIHKEPYQISYGNDLGSSGSWHDMVNSSQSYELIDAVYNMAEWILETANKKEFPFDNELNNELYGRLGRTTEKEIVRSI